MEQIFCVIINKSCWNFLCFLVYRLDNLILEAITNLKDLSGSNKTAIATYIEVF